MSVTANGSIHDRSRALVLLQPPSDRWAFLVPVLGMKLPEPI